MFHIIGEKINGTRAQVGEAIARRDTDYIRSLALRQAEAGAGRIDVNAGTRPDREQRSDNPCNRRSEDKMRDRWASRGRPWSRS